MAKSKKRDFITTLAFLALIQERTWAAEVGLTTEALTPPQSDPSYLTWFMFVIAVWIVVVLANALASSPPDHIMGFIASIGEGPVAHHLYYPCRLGGKPAHLRTMSLRRAEVLAAAGLKKGEWIALDIDALSVRSKVLRVSRQQRNGERLVLLLLKPGSRHKKAAMHALLREWSGVEASGSSNPHMTNRARKFSTAASQAPHPR